MKFQFNNYIIDKIEFLKNEMFSNEEAIELSPTFEVEIALNPDGEDAKISVGIIIFDDYINKGYPFRLYVRVVGFFKFAEFSDKEEIFKFCKLNGVATLFPYLRSAVSSIVTTTNHNNIVLPLMNIANMTKDLKYEVVESAVLNG